jgi:hypothetical protein
MRESKDETFACRAVIKKATDKAILASIDGKDYWIPQSQVHADSECWKAGDRGELVLTQWIAEQKGLV